MKTCSKCNAMLEDNAVFCGKCGASCTDANTVGGFSQPQFSQPQQPQFSQPQFNQPQQPQFNQPQQPQFGQPQQFGQPGFQPAGAAVQKGSNKTAIIVIASVVVLAIVGVILFLFVFKGDYKKDIVGTWKDTVDSSTTITFNSDGTLSMKVSGLTVKGEYTISGSNLKLTYKLLGMSYNEEYTIQSISGGEMKQKDKSDNKISILKKQ